MPVLAADPNYNPVPSTEPQAGGGRFLNVRADANAFGADVGQAVSGLGRTIGQGADVLAENAIRQQEQFNQVVADDSTNQYQDRVNKILYGDPDDPTKLGFLQKKGRDAMDALPETRNQLINLRNEIRGKLQNPRQQLQFDQETRRQQSITLANMGSHYDREYQDYSASVAKAQVNLAHTAMSTALATDDNAGFETGLAAAMRGRLAGLKRQGLADNPDAVNEALQEERGIAVRYKAESLALKNPLAAVQFLKNNSDAIQGDEYNQLLGKYQGKANTIQAQIDAKLITPPAGWTDDTERKGDKVDQFLDLVDMKESGHRNIKQQVVGPNGGYNPSTGTVTGPSSAGGYFQMIDPTWRMAAQAAGIDTDKWKHAVDAPYNVQKKAARALATQFGVEHWTRWNADLASAATAAGFPTTGKLMEDVVVKSKDDDLKGMMLPVQEPGELPDKEIPGLVERLKEIDSSLPADDVQRKIAAFKAARQSYNMAYQDQQRAQKLHQQAVKSQYSAIESEYMERTVPGSAHPAMIKDVLQDQRFDPYDPEATATKKRLVAFIERQNKQDPVEEVTKANTAALFARMNLPEGDPNRLNDENEIKKAYTDGGIVRQDLDWLLKKHDDVRGPNRRSIQKMSDMWLKSVEHKIMGVPIGSKSIQEMMDPEASGRYIQYVRAMDKRIDDYEKAGKDPFKLFDPSNPDFLGSEGFLKPFQPKVSDNLMKPKDATAGFDPAPTLKDLEAGKITKERAIDIIGNAGRLRQMDREVAAEILRKLGVPDTLPTAPMQ